jgi:hypothetical protein
MDAKSDASLGGLVGELTTDLGALLRDEVQLAKLELKEDATRAARVGGMFGAAAFAGWLAAVLLLFAAAWGLAEVMPVGFAFLIVGAVVAVVGVALFAAGRARLRELNMKPEQTIETMQENVQWARQQKS